MTNDQVKAAILKALGSGPKLPTELRSTVGQEGQKLANNIKTLLRAEQISRVQVSVGRWRYYIGKTAPAWKGYHPESRNPKQKPMPQHAMPVKRIEFAADCGRMNRVTLPAFPWDLHA